MCYAKLVFTSVDQMAVQVFQRITRTVERKPLQPLQALRESTLHGHRYIFVTGATRVQNTNHAKTQSVQAFRRICKSK